LPGVPVAVIPNGVRIPPAISDRRSPARLNILYIGRIDPKKGIENLLRGFQQIRLDLGKPAILTIAGGGRADYVAKIAALVDTLDLQECVTMTGMVEGADKRRLFEEADLAVAPSHTENFGMVVAEALAHGVPVIASRGMPWRRLEEMDCGLWIDNSPNSIADGIHRLVQSPLREMGARGRQWMIEEFSWDLVAAKMEKLYHQQVRA
jgi:glycosyltransferase involved in cell wall biosynthesis